MGLFDGLSDLLINGPKSEGRAAGQQQQQIQKQQADERAQKFDMDLFDHMNDQGALPVVGGMVKEPMFNAGNPALGMSPQGDLPAGVASVPEGVGPTAGTVMRKADPQRTFTHKAADGSTVQWEVPTPDAMRNKALYQHISDLMSPAQKQARQMQNDETANATQATSLGQARGKNTADVEKRNAEGIALPSSLEEVLPGITKDANGNPVKVLPTELYDITRAVGQFANYQSEAEARGKKVDRPVKTTLSRDDQGNQTLINEMPDGTVKEIPIKAKGVTKTDASTEPTAYQKFEMGRSTQNDAHARAMVWQNKTDTLQAEEDKLSQQNVAAGEEMRELGTQLQNGELTGTTAKNQAKRRLSTLQAQIDGNNQRVSTIHGQKKNAQTIKNSIMAASGNPAAAEEQKANAAPKTATLGQVNAYAKKYGLDLAAAQKAFEDDGITVGK